MTDFDRDASGGGADELIEALARRVASNVRFKQAASKAERARLRRELGFSAPVASLQTARRLLQSAAILAASRSVDYRQLGYRTAINIHGLLQDQEVQSGPAVRVVLSRLGNFAAFEAAEDVASAAEALPLALAVEEIESATSRTVKAATRELVLTDFQRQLWDTFTAAEDAAVSAPTSAGKSFVLLNFLNSRFATSKNLSVVYLVPTRALLSQVADDLERATKDLISEVPRIVQVPPDARTTLPQRAIYIFTPERLQLLLQAHSDFECEIVIVDEAHLIADGSRGILLQWILGSLLESGAKPQVLFASPTIANLDVFSTVFGIPTIKEARSTEATVAQNFIKVKVLDRKVGRLELTSLGDGKREEATLGTVEIRRSLYTKFDKLSEIPEVLGRGRLNIVYVNGANDAERVAMKIASQRAYEQPTDAQERLAQLAREAVHPRYALVECLLRGVGYHYSNIPPALRVAIEHAFTQRDLDYMVCTSTLLQGVNSPAQNIFMFCPEKGNGRPLSSVDFWNLAGRAGRLRKEFQGNIFLIDYGSWRSKPLAGPKEVIVRPAMTTSLASTRELISVIEHWTADRPRNQLDLESASTRLLVTYRKGRLAETFERAGLPPTSLAARRVAKAVAGVAPLISVPDEILELSPSVSPQKQQMLLQHIRDRIRRNYSTAVERLSPRHPWRTGAYDSYSGIMKLCYAVIWERPEHSRLHRFHALIAMWWMRGYPLPRIVSSQLRRHPKKDPRKVIRDTLSLVEEDIRFKAVRVFTTYNALLGLAYVEEGIDGQDSIEAIPLFLEVGASDQTMISFIEAGVSRSTAVELARRSKDRNMSVEQALSWLTQREPAELGLSSAMAEELERLRIRRGHIDTSRSRNTPQS